MSNKKRISSISKEKYLRLYMAATIILFVNNIFAMPRIGAGTTTPEHSSMLTIQNDILEKKTEKSELSAENKSDHALRTSVLVIKNSSEVDQTAEDSIYSNLKNPPEYPGGDKALIEHIRNNLRYPRQALKKNIEGRVFIQFFVDTEGNISNVKAMKSVDPDLDNEAIRVAKSIPKKWKPAFYEEKPVRSLYTIPILFKIMSRL